MFRFSLATLLFTVVLAAIGYTALAYPTNLWRQAVVTLTVAALIAATLAGVCAKIADALHHARKALQSRYRSLLAGVLPWHICQLSQFFLFTYPLLPTNSSRAIPCCSHTP